MRGAFDRISHNVCRENNFTKIIFQTFPLFKVCPGAGERTRNLLIPFIFSFHHLTAEPQRLSISSGNYIFHAKLCRKFRGK
jgi:hypothetical protein